MRTGYSGCAITALIMTIMLCFFSGPAGAENIQQAYEPSRGEKIALLPFDNFSGDNHAPDNVMPVLRHRLEQKGISVVTWDTVGDFFCERRVRSTGHISGSLAKELRDRFNVSAILVGAIISHFTGENPNFGITARLVDSSTGSLIWADYASSTGEDFTGILGIGRIDSVHALIPRVVDRLFLSFSTVRPFNHKDSRFRVAVMPFRNNSTFKDVGKIATHMFLTELVKSENFTPVEHGNIVESIVENRIRHKGELDFDNLSTLSSVLGVDAILVGTVETYSDGKETQSPPESSINARLLDTDGNKILWFDSFRMNGEDDIIVFDWGKIRSVDNVAHKVVTKLVGTMKPELWY